MVPSCLNVQLLQFGIDVALCVLIWLVQLVIYPAFRHWDAGKFRDAHRGHTRAMSLVVVPLMAGQLGLSIYDVEGAASPVHIVRLALILLVWLSTFFVSVPCHRKLEQGWQPGVVQRLIRTNWIRTVLWSALMLTWCCKSLQPW